MSVKGNWEKTAAEFGYDFWYQPFHNVMISTEWGIPKIQKLGFKSEHVDEGINNNAFIYLTARLYG